MRMAEIAFWLLVDSDGKYTMGTDPDEVTERHEKTQMPLADSWGYQMYEVKLKIRTPRHTEIEVNLTDNNDDGDGPIVTISS
jgi:hypothetical protein